RWTLHCAGHGLKVDDNAIRLCARTPGADLLVCRLYAYLHDCQHGGGDEPDPEHGELAAEYVREHCRGLTAGLSAGQRDRLLEAVRGHEDDATSDDPTIAVCWDADRLDLARVDATPESGRLSTSAARRLKWLI